jgi:hypothetical protein
MADTNGWPSEAERTLCKFGVTRFDLDVRRERHECWLRDKGITAELEICFVATGKIACEQVEERVRVQTFDWVPEG